MKKKLIKVLTFTVVLATFLSCLVLPASAALEGEANGVYLQIYGIEGDSKDSKHDKWINVLDFTHGSEQSVQSGSPDIVGQGMYEPVVFTHFVDKATPKIQEACMKGNFIRSAELHVCETVAGMQTVIYKVKLEGVKIVKAEVREQKMADGTYKTVEEVSLLVNKQTWTSAALGIDNSIGGSTEAYYDQSKKASMFDSSSSVAVAVLGVVVFILAACVVVLLVSSKKRKALAAADQNTADRS